MSVHEVKIEEGKLYLKAKALANYYDVSAPTITAYKKKGLTPTKFNGDKTLYYEVKHADEIKQTIKDKHSQSVEPDMDSGSKKGVEDSVVFQDGRRFFQMDINDPEDLEMIALHALGEMYLDRVEKAEAIKTKQHALRVKKGEYLLVSELNMAIAETLALLRNMMVSVRDQLPIAQVEKLIKENLTSKENKQLTQKIIADEADSIFEDITREIKEALLKRSVKSTKDTASFLKDLLKKYDK